MSSDELQDAILTAGLAVSAVMLKRMAKIADGETWLETHSAQASDIAEITAIVEALRTTVADGSAEQVLAAAEDLNESYAKEYASVGLAGHTIADSVTQTAVVDAATSGIRETVSDDLLLYAYSPVTNAYTDVVTPQASYARAIQRATTQTGVPTEDIIRETVKNVARPGLRVQYPSGRTEPYYSKVRRDVSAAGYETRASLSREIGNVIKADSVDISAHGGCAEDHLFCQGRRYTLAEFDELNGSLARPIGELNCRHEITYVIAGVSSDKYSAEDLETLNDQSTTQVHTRSGAQVGMTRYECEQYQRQFEVSIRDQLAQAESYRAGGLVKDAIACEDRASVLEKGYRSFSHEAGLRPYIGRATI